MIKSDTEYQKAVRRLEDEDKAIRESRAQLVAEGMADDHIQRVLDPLMSFHAQLEEEIHSYERIKRGHIDQISNFAGLGRSVIAMRIAAGKSQRDIAHTIGMDPANYNRLEKNEFHGAKHDLIATILKAIGYRAITTFERVA